MRLVSLLVAVLLGARLLLEMYTDVLWYNQLGYGGVFWRNAGFSALGFAAAFLIVAVPLHLVLRRRLALEPSRFASEAVRQYHRLLGPYRRAFLWAVPAFAGFVAGLAGAQNWQAFALLFTAESFGAADPIYGHDVSFYVMVLPALTFLATLALASSLLVLAALVYFAWMSGHIAARPEGLFVARGTRRAVLAAGAVTLVLVGVRVWLGRYGVLHEANGAWAGALFTDANVRMPSMAILAAACVVVALVFLVSARMRRSSLPTVGLAALALTGLVAGVLVPWGVQQYVVTPSAQSRENPFIKHNIDATRAAYGLDKVEVRQYDATTKASAEALGKDAASLNNVRLLDPNVVSNAFAQLQQYRPYYQFPAQLNVDRYALDGKTQDTVIAVRELNVDGTPDSWVNRHLVYTHGYGVVAAYGSKVSSDGKPEFMQSGIPTSGKLGEYEPRIYFGQKSPDYSIVGAPEGSAPQEIDRPQNTDASAEESRTSFSGNGGPRLDNPVNRLAYALKFGSTNILLSNGVHKESQILYKRDPRERVAAAAPFLTVDDNAYPAVVDGRVQWIVDAYTVSDKYPYSTPTELSSATTDTNTSAGRREALPAKKANYMRNSVKATVDAYDGTVRLYSWDEDPILRAWKRIYPGVIRDRSEMSGGLLSHVRYPQDQFKVQREMLGRYHVTDANRLFNNDDAWVVPNDPTSSAKALQPPYYMSLKMPGESAASFALTTPFISSNLRSGQQRDVMYGFLSANGEAGSTQGKVAEGYGRLTLLELPRDTVVPGPGQAQTRFTSNPTVSKELNLLSSGASQVINGNLLSLPAGDGILYVQPVYVQAKEGIKMPTLRRVLVNFGEEVGFAPTLDEALDQIFKGYAAKSGTGSTSTPADKDTTKPNASKPASDELRQALSSASEAMKRGQDALAKGDFAAYGTAQEDLKKALAAAIAAEEKAANTK
ncbi:UPF0182 family protein [Falsarthrobacter nasiphocae]|uniref:UPF0182 protein J2S35_000383 n=1 Tax=Falsarthrobacter nasiphocae TaxID=189863 RepID=A0AAE4C5F0_9MICC|nr:UPF0182 family protein [Falsarthrobacter nasiphocae]MDR6891443.1 uncharacterized membrane protein (UPF0182 family) [Falsarthrobacter nasiphocae]